MDWMPEVNTIAATKACIALNATHRWVLSGTPLRNSLQGKEIIYWLKQWFFC